MNVFVRVGRRMKRECICTCAVCISGNRSEIRRGTVAGCDSVTLSLPLPFSQAVS